MHADESSKKVRSDVEVRLLMLEARLDAIETMTVPATRRTQRWVQGLGIVAGCALLAIAIAAAWSQYRWERVENQRLLMLRALAEVEEPPAALPRGARTDGTREDLSASHGEPGHRNEVRLPDTLWDFGGGLESWGGASPK